MQSVRSVQRARITQLYTAIIFSGVAVQGISQIPPETIWTRETSRGLPLAVSPDGTLVAGAYGGINVWRAKDGVPWRVFNGSFGGLTSLAFSPDNWFLAAGDADGNLYLYRLFDGTRVWSLRAAGDVTCVKFTPDGTLLSWSSDQDTIQLRNAADGNLLRTIPGHAWSHFNVALSLDGILFEHRFMVLPIGPVTLPAFVMSAILDPELGQLEIPLFVHWRRHLRFQSRLFAKYW